jgi:hypothetical protein
MVANYEVPVYVTGSLDYLADPKTYQLHDLVEIMLFEAHLTSAVR